jgi:hypothetical protein
VACTGAGGLSLAPVASQHVVLGSDGNGAEVHRSTEQSHATERQGTASAVPNKAK